MEQELFNPQSSSVSSSRIIYTPSTFARTSLLHLQEVGSLKALHPHTSKRSDLVSFLCFVVLSGEGELKYEGEEYKLAAGDCVFIDCRKAYSHSTGYSSDGHTTVENNAVENKKTNLRSHQWCHFYAPTLPAEYEKYKERGGRPLFHPDDRHVLCTSHTRPEGMVHRSDTIGGTRGWGFYSPQHYFLQ